MTVLDETETRRAGVFGALGLGLYDANGTVRLFADTIDENNTAMTLVDAKGNPRYRASANGDMRTFDKDGYDRFMLDEDGSVRILDGDIEAFELSKYGMVGADPSGNVTLQFNRLDGTLKTAGNVEQDNRDLKPDDMKKEYAQFCAGTELPNEAALRACEAPETERIMQEFSLIIPETRRTLGGYSRPSGRDYSTGFADKIRNEIATYEREEVFTPPPSFLAVEPIDVVQIFGRLAGDMCYGTTTAPSGASCLASKVRLTTMLRISGREMVDYYRFESALQGETFGWPLQTNGAPGDASNRLTVSNDNVVEEEAYREMLRSTALWDGVTELGTLSDYRTNLVERMAYTAYWNPQVTEVAFRLLAGPAGVSISAASIESALLSMCSDNRETPCTEPRISYGDFRRAISQETTVREAGTGFTFSDNTVDWGSIFGNGGEFNFDNMPDRFG